MNEIYVKARGLYFTTEACQAGVTAGVDPCERLLGEVVAILASLSTCVFASAAKPNLCTTTCLAAKPNPCFPPSLVKGVEGRTHKASENLGR